MAIVVIVAFGSGTPLSGDSEPHCQLSCDSQYITSSLKVYQKNTEATETLIFLFFPEQQSKTVQIQNFTMI